ncbi:MAG: GNAT family N-acetyltransferase [Bacteroidota bacterium]
MPNNSIELAPATINHADSLLPIFSNAENVKYTNFKTFADIVSFRIFIDMFLAIEKGSPLQYGPYSICFDQEIIGLCGLQQINLDAGKSELWYLLHRDHWGKGLAKQAVQILLAMTKENTRLSTIYAEAVSSNKPSWHILESVGFIKNSERKDGFNKEGFAADLLTYSLNMSA